MKKGPFYVCVHEAVLHLCPLNMYTHTHTHACSRVRTHTHTQTHTYAGQTKRSKISSHSLDTQNRHTPACTSMSIRDFTADMYLDKKKKPNPKLPMFVEPGCDGSLRTSLCHDCRNEIFRLLPSKLKLSYSYQSVGPRRPTLSAEG